MSLSDIDVRIKNVIDMVFLYDFFEPTLAILFSPQQTWTGYVVVVFLLKAQSNGYE
jgi:cleavage and polyadenylation specificity factor subunit 1